MLIATATTVYALDIELAPDEQPATRRRALRESVHAKLHRAARFHAGPATAAGTPSALVQLGW